MRKLLWESIKVSSEFKKITNSSQKIHTPFFIYFRAPNQNFKLGVVASRRIGGAVQRNRAKRILRSAFSKIYKDQKCAIVLIAKPEILSADYQDIVQSMNFTALKTASREKINEIKYQF